MLLTQKNEIRGMSKKQYGKLLFMCRCANSLANAAEYHIRHFRRATNSYLSFEQNCKVSRHNRNYRMLQANVAQQTLRRQDKKYQSFFGLLKARKNGTYKGTVHAPHFRRKGGLDNLYIPGQYIVVRANSIAIPMSRAFRKEFGDEEILITIPPHVRGKKIHEVQVLPTRDGSHIDVAFVYEQEDPKPLKLHKSNIASFDPGVVNFMTGVCTNGTTIIIDGRWIKSINQWYNKQKAREQAKLPEGVCWSQLLTEITRKRDNRLRDFMHKAANEMIRWAAENNCGTIVIGASKEQKQCLSMGKVNNQNFAFLPHARFRKILEYKCKRAGIRFVEQEESYTSKASALDNDFIPTFDPAAQGTFAFSGRRVKRGLYRSKDGILLNADVNGALNIARKSKQNGTIPKCARLCRGVLDTPSRVRIV